MTKIQRLSILLILIVSSLSAETNIFDKNLDFKEGIINYTVSGSETGTKTVYIKEYGKRRVIYTNTKSKFMHQNRGIDKVTYITPKWIYEMDLKSNINTKHYNLNYLLNKRVKELTLDQKQKLEKNLQSTHNTHSEKILGYLCKHKMVQGVSTYSVKNFDLVLKTQVDILGFHSKTQAIEIEKKPVDANIFTLAKNLTITSTPEENLALEQKADQIIESLL